ncbi:MAG: 50S ribosomal protein L3 [Patescibacteria group bacterium]
MKFILAKKIEMAQIFDDAGAVHPVTWLLAGPVVVTDVRTKNRDGYDALQLGFGTKKEKTTKKPQRIQFKDVGLPEQVKEVRVKAPAFKRGDTIDVSIFKEGDKVAVSGTTKGKGFQGVVKRHGFKGGPRTHGQKHSEREPGSIGSVWPQRVVKGTRMAGRMGGTAVTMRNLKIIKIIPEKNLIAIEGAVPGRRGSAMVIRG